MAAKTKKPAKKAATAAPKLDLKKPVKITPASKARTKGEVYKTIAAHAGLHHRDVQGVLHVMGSMIAADLSKNGPGVFNVPGMMRVMVQRKPATKAREGVNPFTGEKMMFKAKPARNVVKVRPLKGLKDMV
ncbi:MAG: HU family DNA-binding protein [Phycisphaerales bacterium]|nr:HU family DNA-binding protein [Phycisphaerales bacterium]